MGGAEVTLLPDMDEETGEDVVEEVAGANELPRCKVSLAVEVILLAGNLTTSTKTRLAGFLAWLFPLLSWPSS